jgi:hypothetical protein
VVNVAEPRNGLPARWTRTDEWYNFRSNPRASVHVLATIDESSYQGGEMGADHPIAWWHDYDGGRAWYTAGGHTIESWSELLFLRHVLSGIEYAIAPRAAAAKIVSLRATVKDRRVTVTLRYSGCDNCRAELRVGGTTTALRAGDGVATGRSPRLAPGHLRAVVVLTAGAVRLTAGRPVVIR